LLEWIVLLVTVIREF